MLNARADQRVLGYLGRALSMELSAVQLYSTQACLVAAWGLNDAAERLRREAHEELGHADRIIARMLAIGVAPAASQLRPVQLGQDLGELLMVAQRFEWEIVELYDAAVRYCAQAGQHDSRLFFQALLEEEQAHGRDLQQWLDQLAGAPGGQDQAWSEAR